MTYQGVVACHKEAVLKREHWVKSRLNLALADDNNLSDILGEQANSFRAYLDDKEGHTHATFKDSQGWTLFHLASKTATYQEWNNDSVFESLLTCKVKLSYTDAEGHTDWDCNSSGDSRIHVNLHLLPGISEADATAKIAGGRTAVHIAAAQGHADVVGCLLDSKLFAIDDRDDQGMTALQLAVAGRHAEAIEILIRRTPGFKADAECRQVLTSLVQEQANQGADHRLSDTMLALLSHYHDQAWCRPTFQQGRAYNAAMLGTLADLPGNAVSIILQQLELEDLVQLDAATMAQVPIIQERLLQKRYAGRWLQLTRRMPGVGRPPPKEELSAKSDHSESELSACGSDYQTESGESSEQGDDADHDSYIDPKKQLTLEEKEQLWGQLQLMSKHSLLQTLLQQICHINDVAALIDDWVQAHVMSWSCEREELGFSFEEAYYASTGSPCGGPELIHRMRQLQHKVVAALSIGFEGFLDRFRDLSHPHNKACRPEFAELTSHFLFHYREWHNQLLFLCSLHRLQQLPAKAVLTRLHSIFSRCCRYDLLLLSTRFACRRRHAGEAIWPEAYAEDVVIAFEGMTRDLRYSLDMPATDRAELKQHIGSMVGAWVNKGSVWNDLEPSLNTPIHYTSCACGNSYP